MKTKHYVYEIINTVLNKSYVGVRSCDIEPDQDLGTHYSSSSSDVDFMFEQQEHRWRFSYVILQEFETRKEAIEYEIYLHNKFDVGKNPNYYNKSKQTSSGFDTAGKTPWNKGLTKSDTRVQKYAKTISKNRVKNGTAKGENNPMFGRNLWAEKNEQEQQEIYSAWKAGIAARSDEDKAETIRLRKKIAKDRVWVNNGIKSKMPKSGSEILKNLLDSGWEYGRI